MTNERAIEILNFDLDILGQYGDGTAEAYKMAIKALEQQPCENCISREEIRKVLSDEVFALMKLHTINPEENPNADAMALGVNWSLNTLMELPPVAPQRPEGRWIATENEEMNIDGYFCSCCDLPMETEERTDYCPNCGAKMKAESEDK